jgi:glucose/arabinose dehydrogenase
MAHRIWAEIAMNRTHHRLARGDAVVSPPGGRHKQKSHRHKSKEQEMTRRHFTDATSAGRSLRGLVTSALLAAALPVTAAVLAPSAAVAATTSAGQGDAQQVFYTTSGAGTGLPNGAEIFAITVAGATVTTRDVGPTHGGDCGSLARSPHGTLYSMCGALFGTQRLATINKTTGRAHLFGVPVPGLAVMALAFRGGTLYAVGDCNPAPVTFECVADKDFNALYQVNLATGAFTRIGPTGAPQFFMDLTIDPHGTMLGVTSTVNPSLTPAILYRINPATGKVTKLVNLVGSNTVMGLAFGRDGNLYATDFTQNPGLYRVNTTTGFETAIAALPFGFSSGLELMNPGG